MDVLSLLLICVIAGFVAQLVDGSLGMGYGIMLSIFLFSMGIPPVQVSASVHFAKFISAGVSGVSHWKFGNVDKSLMAKLAIGGILGAVVGTYALTSAPPEYIKPFIAVYLSVMGLVIFYKAFSQSSTSFYEGNRSAPLLGMVGGFFDAIGGGGWGPIVTSGLLVRGRDPRVTVGSVSLSEFFVAVTVVGLLLSELPLLITQIQILAGLVIGSMLAAPLAAYICGRVAPRPLMFAVGSLIMTLSLSTIITTLL